MTAEQPSVEALVERVRRPIDSILYVVPGWTGPPDWRTEMAQDALAALVSLTAALERAEREVAEWKADGAQWCDRYVAEKARAQKAEAENRVHARTIRLQQERTEAADIRAQKAEDELSAEHEAMQGWYQMYTNAMARAQKAEAEGDILREREVELEKRLRKTEAVVEAARRFFDAEADENDLYRALTAYDEPPTEQADFDWKQQEC